MKKFCNYINKLKFSKRGPCNKCIRFESTVKFVAGELKFTEFREMN